jgi:hypothetical protein
MSDNNQPTPVGAKNDEPGSEAPVSAVSTSRRRFTRAGLSASAVLTLSSRPALATRCSISAMGSMAPSSTGDINLCGGNAPSTLASNPSSWSSTTPFDPGDPFNGLGLPFPIPMAPPAPVLTIQEALVLVGGYGPEGLQREATAGLINSYILPEATYGYTPTTFRNFLSDNASQPETLYTYLVSLNGGTRPPAP